MNSTVQPFLKWAGGKRQLLTDIRKYVPSEFNTYYEPFIGAGAVLFDLAPKRAIINDNNQELINLYKVIKDARKVKLLLESLHNHKNEESYYYNLRILDRSEEYINLSDVEKASRFLYLNKTGYNGLYRVNSKGFFNVPFGKYKSPDYVNKNTIMDAHKYFNENDIVILNQDFEDAVKGASKGDFVYFDPPYDPVSKTSSFTSYTKDNFGDKEQIRLRNLFIDLYERGCFVLLSNSNTEFINKLYNYPGIEVKTVEANRNINSKGSGRGKIKEVLISNIK